MRRKLSVTKRFTFEASHSLPQHDGKCKNPHGHSYKLFVTLSGKKYLKGPKQGMIVDFGDMKKIVNEVVIEIFDHQDINVVVGDLPTTVENIAYQIFTMLEAEKFENGARITKIVLYETEDNFATVEI